MNDLANLIEAVRRGESARVESMLDANAALVEQRDKTGATALHYAAMEGRREIVRLLIERGANVNNADGEFGATPSGWAIEYLRELGGHLGIELDDLAYAIEQGDVRWAARFLRRFPSLRQDRHHINGKSFRQLARESGHREIAKLFGLDSNG